MASLKTLHIFFSFYQDFFQKVLTKSKKWCKICYVMLCYAEVYQLTLGIRGRRALCRVEKQDAIFCRKHGMTNPKKYFFERKKT